MKQIEDVSDYLADVMQSLRPMIVLPASIKHFFEEGNFREALRHLEAELSKLPNAAENKLHWIRCQLCLGDVPASALSAPLEELFPTLKETILLHPLGCITCLELAQKLLLRNQTRISLSLLEKASELLVSIQPEQRIKLAQVIKGVLLNEKEKASKHLNSGAYIANLDRKLNELKSEEKHLEKRSRSKAAPLLSAKSILENSGTATAEPAFDNNPTQREISSSKVSPIVSIESNAGKSELPSSGHKRSLTNYFVVGAIILLCGYVLRERLPFVSSADSELVGEMMVSNITPGESMALPELQMRGSVTNGEKSRIEEVEKRLEKLNAKTKELNGSVIENEVVVETQTEEERPEHGVSRSSNEETQESSANVGKADLSPKLPEVLEKDLAKIPQLDPDKIGVNRVERIDPYNRRIEDDHLQPGIDGKVFGPPSRGPDRRGTGELVGLDGKPVKGLEVTQFTLPRKYEVIAETNVLSSPSVVSERVQRLEVGAVVQASATFGPWLEVQSNQGRRGYIYAQDAVPVKK